MARKLTFHRKRIWSLETYTHWLRYDAIFNSHWSGLLRCERVRDYKSLSLSAFVCAYAVAYFVSKE